MRWVMASAAVLSMALLAACVPTKDEYNATRQIVGESPAARKMVMDKCLRDSRTLTYAQKQQLAATMRAPEDRVGSLVCERVIAAMLSGRLSYEEARNLSRVSEAKLIRIIQGR